MQMEMESKMKYYDLHVTDAEIYHSRAVARETEDYLPDTMTQVRLLRDIAWRAKYASASDHDRSQMRRALVTESRRGTEHIRTIPPGL
jgi:hypothetical protein